MLKLFLSKKGFTLTELLIVVLILGILTTVSIPVFEGILKAQKQNDCNNNKKTIESTIKEAMVGMMDNGAPQKNENGELYINFSRSDTAHISKIQYPDGKTEQCFKICYNESDEAGQTVAFTLYDLRGGYYTMEQAVADAKETANVLIQKEENGSLNEPLTQWESFVVGLKIIKTTPPGNKTLKSDYEIQNSISHQKYKMGCLKSIRADEGGATTEINEGYFLKKDNAWHYTDDDSGKEMEIPFYTHFDNKEIPVCPFAETDKTGKATHEFYYVTGDGSVLCACCDDITEI